MKMNMARKIEAVRAELEVGVVEAVGAELTVRLASERIAARRAKSCLVAPDVGDRVLCASEPAGIYVLAVLEGREGEGTRLTAEGDLKIQAPSGTVTVCAGEGIDLITARDFGVLAGSVAVRAKRGSVAVEELGLVSRLVRAEAAKMVVFAEQLESSVDSLMSRAKRVFRFVAETEQVRAGTLDLRAEKLASVRAETTVVAARVVAKIDAGQVHIG
jgi:hypothetical protein